jgi:hypothetical protein
MPGVIKSASQIALPGEPMWPTLNARSLRSPRANARGAPRDDDFSFTGRLSLTRSFNYTRSCREKPLNGAFRAVPLLKFHQRFTQHSVH